MYNQVTLKPRMSEKAYRQSLLTNTYIFDVPADANKHTVARAVASQFEVVVTKVNITNLDGKAKRTVTKRKQIAGRQNDVKKAYVTLAEGNSLPFFAAEAAEDAKDAKEAEVVSKDKKKEKK